MSIVSQLLTIVRGEARNAAETLIEANAMQLLEQQIRECEDSIRSSKRDLIQVVAERISVERNLCTLEQGLKRKEAEARQALEFDDGALAMELADGIAEHELHIEHEQESLRLLRQYEIEVRDALKAALRQIQAYRSDMRMLKATAHAQRASLRLGRGKPCLGERLTEAKETSERIHRSQQSMADQLDAMRQVDEALAQSVGQTYGGTDGLRNRRQRAQSILDRLRAQSDRRQAKADGV